MPTTTSKNLGQVAAVIASPAAPTNTNLIWLDTSSNPSVKKIWDPVALAWQLLTQSATVSGDNWGSQVAIVDTTLDGEGITGTPLKIAQQGAASGQILKWNGATWLPANETTGGLASVNVDNTIQGNGTSGQPLGIAQHGAVTGQVLTWNGTAWVPTAPNNSGALQSGMILIWSGPINLIPSGWSLCDGTNSTPNLSGMFVVGYNPADADYNVPGKTGGLKINQLTANQNGPHTHGINDPGHTHAYNYPGNDKFSGNGVDASKPSPVVQNTSSRTTGITLQNSGAGAAIENRPPYYVIAFIMKN